VNESVTDRPGMKVYLLSLGTNESTNTHGIRCSLVKRLIIIDHDDDDDDHIKHDQRNRRQVRRWTAAYVKQRPISLMSESLKFLDRKESGSTVLTE